MQLTAFIPKVIGALPILGCVAVLSAQSVVFAHAHMVEHLVFPLTAPGELSILLWVYKSLTLKPIESRLAYAR